MSSTSPLIIKDHDAKNRVFIHDESLLQSRINVIFVEVAAFTFALCIQEYIYIYMIIVSPCLETAIR